MFVLTQMRHSCSSPMAGSSSAFKTSAAWVYLSFDVERGVSGRSASTGCGCDRGRERTERGLAERRPVGGRKTSQCPVLGRSSSASKFVAQLSFS